MTWRSYHFDRGEGLRQRLRGDPLPAPVGEQRHPRSAVTPRRLETPELAPPGEVPGVRLAVVVARKRHRRAFDHGRELVSPHVRVDAEAQRLALVVEPNLDALAVDLGVGLGAVTKCSGTELR